MVKKLSGRFSIWVSQVVLFYLYQLVCFLSKGEDKWLTNQQAVGVTDDPNQLPFRLQLQRHKRTTVNRSSTNICFVLLVVLDLFALSVTADLAPQLQGHLINLG
jgi:hypothetical protein